MFYSLLEKETDELLNGVALCRQCQHWIWCTRLFWVFHKINNSYHCRPVVKTGRACAYNRRTSTMPWCCRRQYRAQTNDSTEIRSTRARKISLSRESKKKRTLTVEKELKIKKYAIHCGDIKTAFLRWHSHKTVFVYLSAMAATLNDHLSFILLNNANVKRTIS